MLTIAIATKKSFIADIFDIKLLVPLLQLKQTYLYPSFHPSQIIARKLNYKIEQANLHYLYYSQLIQHKIHVNRLFPGICNYQNQNKWKTADYALRNIIPVINLLFIQFNCQDKSATINV